MGIYPGSGGNGPTKENKIVARISVGLHNIHYPCDTNLHNWNTILGKQLRDRTMAVLSSLPEAIFFKERKAIVEKLEEEKYGFADHYQAYPGSNVHYEKPRDIASAFKMNMEKHISARNNLDG